MIPQYFKQKIENRSFSYYGTKYCLIHKITSNRIFCNSSNKLLGIERYCKN